MPVIVTESYECNRCGIRIADDREAMDKFRRGIGHRIAPRGSIGQELEDLDPVHTRVLIRAHAVAADILESVSYSTLLLCNECGRAFVSWLAREPEGAQP